MVVKVYGSCEGASIVFTSMGGDLWECDVPISNSGEYVIDLYAEDDAGNIAYTATILFIVDVKHLKVEIKFIKFSEDARLKNLFTSSTKIVSMKETASIKSELPSNTDMKHFVMTPTKCEVCGGEQYELSGDV